MYWNSYFRLLRQRHCFLSLYNSLIKLIVLNIYLSQKTDFERSKKRSKNLQNYNCLYKSRISQSLSYFILFRLKLSSIVANVFLFVFRSTLFNEFLISINRFERRVLNLIFAWMFRIFKFNKLSFVTYLRRSDCLHLNFQ